MVKTELYAKIGKLLQMERVRQKIDLGDLATTLKITEANLQAVEEGDATKLPSDLYFKLFAKSYCEELGIDFEATVEAIQQDLDDEPIDERSSNDTTEESGSTTSSSTEDKNRPSSREESSTKNGKPLKKLAYLLGSVLLVFVIVVVVNQLLFQDSELKTDPASVPVAVVDMEETTATSSNDKVGYDWDVPDYTESEPLTLTLMARSESWATIFSDGDTAIYRTLTPGRRYEVTAKYRLRVSVGIPSVVTIELNGQPVNLRNPESGRISSVKIDQVNLQAILEQPLTHPPRSSSPPPQPTTRSATPDTTASNATNANATSSEAVAPAPVNIETPKDTSEGR